MVNSITGSFLVNVHDDPIVVKIRGRASYVNCAPLNDFFKDIIDQGRYQFLLDFSECLFMDSTFIGIIAGTALSLNGKASSQFSLFGLNKRNRDLMENMGLPKILNIVDRTKPLEGTDHEKLEECTADKNLILQAHRSLVEANPKNQTEFQDLINFLESRISS